MTDHTKEILSFNQFFSDNYKYLKDFCKSINPAHNYEDTLHHCYLKAYDKISRTGYDGDDYLNYFRVILMNNYKGDYKKERKYQMINISDPDFISYIDNRLLFLEEQDEQDQQLYNRNVFINSIIFDYLDKYCSQKEIFIFKSYFLLHHKKLTYKKLAEITGYSLNSVANIIKKIKKQLRRDIISYINSGVTMDELINDVKILLETKNVNRYWSEYCNMYNKITGNNWMGCKCKGQNLYSWLNNWYNKNKENEN